MAAVVRATSLERDPLKLNFKNFLFKVWRSLGYGPPTDIQYDIADWLQHGPDKSVTMGFRGVAKSYITVPYGIWTLYREPEDSIVLTVSATSGGAALNANFAYQMIDQWDWLAHMKPKTNQRRSSTAFDVSDANPKKFESFCSESLFGQITGRRATVIVPDDVETPNTAETEGDRAKLRLRFAELGGAVLLPGGKIKVLGTAQTEETLYLDLITERGYACRIWPLVYPIPHDVPEKDELRKTAPWLAPMISRALEANPELAGTSTEPSRFDEGEIHGKLIEYGKSEFDRQFKMWMDAGAAKDKPLKWRDVPVIEIAKPSMNSPLKVPGELTWSPLPANAFTDIKLDSLNGDSQAFAPMKVDLWQPPEIVRLDVDPSGGGDDETAWIVTAEHLGRVFLLHRGSALEGFSKETLKAIARDAKEWGVNRVGIEKNFGGGMFSELLSPYLQEIGHPCSIEDEAVGNVQKERRIVDSLEGLATSHRLVARAQVLREDWDVQYPQVSQEKRRFYRLTYQLSRMSRQRGAVKHDDRLDALASAARKYLGTLRRMLEQAARESREANLIEEGEKIIETRRKLGLPLVGMDNGKKRLGGIISDAGGLVNSLLFRGRK